MHAAFLDPSAGLPATLLPLFEPAPIDSWIGCECALPFLVPMAPAIDDAAPPGTGPCCRVDPN